MSWEAIIKRKRWDDEKPDMSRYWGKSWADKQKEQKDQKAKDQEKRESMSRNPKGAALLKLQAAEENSKKLEESYRASQEYPYVLNDLLELVQKEEIEGLFVLGISSMGIAFSDRYGEKNSLNKTIEEIFFSPKYEELEHLDEIIMEQVSLKEEKIEGYYFNSELYSTLDFIEELLKGNKKVTPKKLDIRNAILQVGKSGVTITDEPMPDEQKSILNRMIVRLIEVVEESKNEFKKFLSRYQESKNTLLETKNEKGKELDKAKKVENELRSAFRKKYPSRR